MGKTIKEIYERLLVDYSVRDNIIKDEGPYQGEHVATPYFHRERIGVPYHAYSLPEGKYRFFVLHENEIESFPGFAGKDSVCIFEEAGTGKVTLSLLTAEESRERIRSVQKEVHSRYAR